MSEKLMSLESLYNNAPNGTYVGQVKTKQAQDVQSTTGVNFMDGTRRARNQEATDVFQTEFTRNAPGEYATGGAQGSVAVPGQTKSRWTDRGLDLAFTAPGKGPDSLVNGFYNTTRFRVWKATQTEANVHNYVPSDSFNQANKGGYVNINDSARIRALASPPSR